MLPFAKVGRVLKVENVISAFASFSWLRRYCANNVTGALRVQSYISQIYKKVMIPCAQDGCMIKVETVISALARFASLRRYFTYT